jgi:hypothetical protein
MAIDANTKLVATAFARIEEHLEAMLRRFAELDPEQPEVHRLLEVVS